MFAEQNVVTQLLLNAGVLFAATIGGNGFSLTKFKDVFQDIAYVLVSSSFPIHDLQNLQCTCHLSALYQQCPHSLHAEGLQVAPQSLARDFGLGPSQKRAGRPKGKGKAKPKRVVQRQSA